MGQEIELLKAKDVMKIANRGLVEYKYYNWHGKQIKIRQLLSQDECIKVADDICSMITTEDDKIVSDLYEYIFMMLVVLAYTNIELPDDPEEKVKLLFYSDIYDVILLNSNKKQIDSIRYAVNRYIDSRYDWR